MNDTTMRTSNQRVTDPKALIMTERMWKEHFDLAEKAVVKTVFSAKQVRGKEFSVLIAAAEGSELVGAAKAGKLLKSKAPIILKALKENALSRQENRAATFKINRAATTIDLDGPVPKPKPKAKAKAKRTRKPKTLVDVFATDDAEET